MSSSVPSGNYARKQPLIGISLRHEFKTENFYLKRFYSEAIFGAGGIPVYVPLIPKPEYINTLAAKLDGVLLSGSNSDIDPFRYGQAPHVKLGPVSPLRDELDRLLLVAAENRRMPVLGICFGLQSINVYRGGTLFQDLESQVEGVIKHEQGEYYDRPSHKVDFKEGSLLAQLVGANAWRVNSSHHEAVDQLGRDLMPIAWASDNVVEAVISTRPGQFVLGVQWHPEVGWDRDRLSQAIFSHFVQQAAEFS